MMLILKSVSQSSATTCLKRVVNLLGPDGIYGTKNSTECTTDFRVHGWILTAVQWQMSQYQIQKFQFREKVRKNPYLKHWKMAIYGPFSIYIYYTLLGSIFGPFCIQSCVRMNRIIKRLSVVSCILSAIDCINEDMSVVNGKWGNFILTAYGAGILA